MKKVLTIALALALTLSLGSVAFASTNSAESKGAIAFETTVITPGILDPENPPTDPGSGDPISVPSDLAGNDLNFGTVQFKSGQTNTYVSSGTGAASGASDTGLFVTSHNVTSDSNAMVDWEVSVQITGFTAGSTYVEQNDIDGDIVLQNFELALTPGSALGTALGYDNFTT